MLNNPIRFNDPSGHRACGGGEVAHCDGSRKYDGSAAADWARRNWDKEEDAKCEESCTEFVSRALRHGGLKTEPGQWYEPEDCQTTCAWNFTDALHNYLTDQENGAGFESIVIPAGTDLNEYFKDKEIPAGSIVFYDNGFTGKTGNAGEYRFDHAAITTGQTVTFNGVTGPEVVDMNNGHVQGPHFIGDTSTPYTIVIVFLP